MDAMWWWVIGGVAALLLLGYYFFQRQISGDGGVLDGITKFLNGQ